MTLLDALVGGLAVAFLVIGVAYRMSSSSKEEIIESRLAQFNASGRVVTNLSDVELSLSFFDRVLRSPLERLSNRLGKITPGVQQAEIENRLVLAGRPAGLNAGSFFALQIGLALVMGIVGLFLGLLFASAYGSIIALITIVAFVILGFLIPTFVLSYSVRQRQHELLVSLPSALDLLTISVEAGLGFDSALSRVADKYHNVLSNEFNRVLSEIQLGRPRQEALTDMGARSHVDEVNTFIQAIVQSEQLGVGIANVLRFQSEEIRRRRRQRAEEAGQKAPLKMLFPMVFCIFPVLFVVLLGPAFIKVLGQFSHS